MGRRLGGGMDRLGLGGGFSGGSTNQSQPPFLDLFHLHRSARTCASNIIGAGPGSIIVAAGV